MISLCIALVSVVSLVVLVRWLRARTAEPKAYYWDRYATLPPASALLPAWEELALSRGTSSAVHVKVGLAVWPVRDDGGRLDASQDRHLGLDRPARVAAVIESQSPAAGTTRVTTPIPSGAADGRPVGDDDALVDYLHDRVIKSRIPASRFARMEASTRKPEPPAADGRPVGDDEAPVPRVARVEPPRDSDESRAPSIPQRRNDSVFVDGNHGRAVTRCVPAARAAVPSNHAPTPRPITSTRRSHATGAGRDTKSHEAKKAEWIARGACWDCGGRPVVGEYRCIRCDSRN